LRKPERANRPPLKHFHGTISQIISSRIATIEN
jgi:hypothetical protein